MLKQSLAAAAFFSAVAANATGPVVVPHFTLNTSIEAANGTVVVTPRGYVVASIPHENVPMVSSCSENTDDILYGARSITGMLDILRMTGAARTSDGQTAVSNLSGLADGMRFSFEQCQKSARSGTKDKAHQTGAALDALQSILNSMRERAP